MSFLTEMEKYLVENDEQWFTYTITQHQESVPDPDDEDGYEDIVVKGYDIEVYEYTDEKHSQAGEWIDEDTFVFDDAGNMDNLLQDMYEMTDGIDYNIDDRKNIFFNVTDLSKDKSLGGIVREINRIIKGWKSGKGGF